MLGHLRCNREAGTLDFLISIGLRLLIFGIFSRVYGLIREPMLIDFSQIFSAEFSRQEKVGKVE